MADARKLLLEADAAMRQDLLGGAKADPEKLRKLATLLSYLPATRGMTTDGEPLEDFLGRIASRLESLRPDRGQREDRPNPAHTKRCNDAYCSTCQWEDRP